MNAPDAVVVGGGAIGLASALELAYAGARVTLVEAAPVLPAGCSAGNAGLVCPSHATPLASRTALRQGLHWALAREGSLAIAPRPALAGWLARFVAATAPARERAATGTIRTLSLASLELHRRYRDELGTGLEPRGTLNLYETEDGLAAGLREAAENAAAGIGAEILSARETSALVPALAGEVAGAVLYPGELSGDPAEFVRAVDGAVREAGVDVLLATEALSLAARHGGVVAVETTAGRIAAGTAVLAAGAWTPRLARSVGLVLPVEGGKGYHLDYALADGDPHLPLFFQEARSVITPLPGRLRLTGMLALTGLDLSVNERHLAAIEQAGSRRIRGFGERRRVEVWRGLRPCSPDGLPLVGPTAAVDRLVVATGHATLGFTLAPLTGRLVAQVVAGERPEHDLTPLSPDRFHGLSSLLGRPGRQHGAG